MPDGSKTILEYLSAIDRNGRIYLLNHGFAFHAFSGLVEYFHRIGQRLQNGRDQNGKTYPSLIPFILLMQRQALNAFAMLSTFRSYEAWVLFRPCLEGALIIGKWLDDLENHVIWGDKANRFDEYRKTYSGRGLRSQSIERSPDIQKALSRLNDEFMHANPSYFQRHTRLEPAGQSEFYLKVEFFDDRDEGEVHTLAFLHLLVVVLDAVDKTFATLLVGQLPHRPQVANLEAELRTKAETRAADDTCRGMLTELGLWTLTPAAA